MASSAAEAVEIAKWILKQNPKAELILKAQVRCVTRKYRPARLRVEIHQATAAIKKSSSPW